jgi:hypothetical protein
VGIALADRVLGMDFSMSLGGTTFDFASSDYIVLPGVLASTTLLVVVSLLTPASPPEKWKPFFTPPGASLADALEE